MASHLFPPLNALRRRERLIAGAWAAARWLAVVLAGLVIACLIDWWIDLRRDTPYTLRVGMLAAQIVVAAVAAAVLFAPVVRRRSHEELALFVEEKLPALGHRLISAVQFHHGGPKVAGMSQAMIAETTREAGRAIGELNFPRLADHRRLQSAGWLALAVVAVVAVAGAMWPRTMPALIARQLLADCPIPRQNQITNLTALIQPASEPVELRFRIDGPPPSSGELRIAPVGGSAERFTSEVTLDDGVWKLSHAAPTGDFDLEAWISRPCCYCPRGSVYAPTARATSCRRPAAKWPASAAVRSA
jgi:chromate transport protein ChrA